MAAAHSAAQRSPYPPPGPYNDDLRLPSIKDLHFPFPNRHRQEQPQPSDNPPPPAYDPSPSPVHDRSARLSQTTWIRPTHHAAHPPPAPPPANHVHQPHPQHHAPPSSPSHEPPLRHQEYAPRHENDGYATPGIPLSAQTTPIPGSVNSGPAMRGDEYHQHPSSKRLRANDRTPRNSSGNYSYSSYSTGMPPPSPYHQTSPVSAVHPGQHSSPPSTEGSSQHHNTPNQPTYATYQTPYIPPSRPANTAQPAPVSSVQHSAPPPPPPPSHHTPHSAPYPSPTHTGSHWDPPSSQQPPAQPPVPQQSHGHPQHYHHPPPIPTAPTPAPPASHHAPPPQYSQHMHPPPPHVPTHSHSHPPPPPPQPAPEPPSYQQPVHVQHQPPPQQINPRTTVINPAQLDTRGSYPPSNPPSSTTAPPERSFAPDPTMVELAELCSSLYDFASRYAQLHGAMPHVVPQSQEIVAMSAHAHNVVRLLEELRRESMDDEMKNDSDSASDDHRPPKRPWEDMAQDGNAEGDSSINYDESYDDAPIQGQSTAEQDMELIRTKRATTTAGASSNTSQPKSKYRKRSRATPPGRCHSCNIRETPEWRRGPDGARTLCNACGLHYAKLMRKQNKMNPGPNGEPPPAIDMEMLRASTRAAEAEKSNRAKTEENDPSTSMAHHQGFFQVMTPSIEQVPGSSPTAESQPTSSGTSSGVPPPPWSTTSPLGRTYAPEQVPHQSYVRSSVQDHPSSR